MNQLNVYDYTVLAVYMLMMVGIGFYFSKYMKSDSDYFKAGNKLTWWIAAFSAYMSAFSSYMFTGGAGLVYKEGLTGVIILWSTGLAIFTGYLLFAKLWRRSRVTTLMEFLEQRYNLVTHQVASWTYIPLYVIYCSVVLYSLGIFVSSALGIDIYLIIWISSVVILIYTLLGGVWAVSMTDTMQFLFLLPICLLLIPLSLIEVHGFKALVADTPPHYFAFPTTDYPWYWLIGYFILLVHGQNTNPVAQRYFSVRDEKEAKKVSMFCAILFTVGLLIWGVPPMAARILYPDLGQYINLPNPHEGSYVAMAMRVLPHGLVGLLISAIFAAAMSSVSGVYNVVSGVMTKDVFQRLSKRELSPRVLVLIGQVFTLVVGVIATWISIKMAQGGEGSFKTMVKLSVLTGTPLSLPMLLGFLSRKAPAWSGLFSFVCSGVLALIFAFCQPVIDWLAANYSEPVQFAITMFSIFFVGLITYFGSALIFKDSAEDRRRIEAFFKKLDTPVDVEREIEAGGVDHARMARFVGLMSLIITVMLGVFIFIPGSFRDHLINVIMTLTMGGFTALMYYVGRKRKPAPEAE
jgi:solute:Na+ symporter, SSS family